LGHTLFCIRVTEGLFPKLSNSPAHAKGAALSRDPLG
jgi:hypothetical protein